MNNAARNSAGLWGVSLTLVMALGVLFSLSREKPPWLFALGFGGALGLAGLLLAGQLQVPIRRWNVVLVSICAALGVWSAVLISIAQHFRREQPQHALATQLLRQFPSEDGQQLAGAESFGWKAYAERALQRRTHCVDASGSLWLGLFLADGGVASLAAMAVMLAGLSRRTTAEPPS